MSTTAKTVSKTKTTKTTKEKATKEVLPEVKHATQIVDQEEVAALAYSLWEKRGFAHGSDITDWLTAEAMIAAR